MKPAVPTSATNLHLVDEFEDIQANATKVKQLCTPANKNGAKPAFASGASPNTYVSRPSR